MEPVLVLESLQFVAVAGTMVFIAIQVRHQARDYRGQGDLRGFQLYNSLLQQYHEVLRRADERPELNTVWEAIEPKRRKELRDAQQAGTWGAWHIMNDVERSSYRLVRRALEVFEQAYIIHSHFDGPAWLDAEAWDKWRHWMVIWKQSPYYAIVIEDAQPRFLKRFITYLEEELDREVDSDARHIKGQSAVDPPQQPPDASM